MDQQIRVLVVDDDEPHAAAVAESLERVGYDCVVATSGEEGLRLIEEQVFDIVITDLIMDGVGGLEVLAKAKRELPDAEVVILTGHSTIKTAVTAMQAGASTYLTKPLDINELRTKADKASQSQRLQRSNIELQKQLNEKFGFEGVIGNSSAMHAVVAKLRQIAPTSASVLITGESGTGKELAAKALHINSPRKNKPFVPLNCAELSAKTCWKASSSATSRGRSPAPTAIASAGFSTPTAARCSWTRSAICPSRSRSSCCACSKAARSSAWAPTSRSRSTSGLISATNRDLADAIAEGKFRQDLYHRLKVVSVKLPPCASGATTSRS